MDPNQNNPGQSFSPSPQPSGAPEPSAPQQPQQFSPQPDVTPPAPATAPEPPQPQVAPAPAAAASAQPYGPPAPAVGQPYAPQSAAAPSAEEENPHKSYLVALLLSWLLGSLGADRFYLGKMGTAIAKLLTFGGLGIWTLVDLLLLAFGKLRAADDNRPLEGFAKNRGWVKILAIVIIVVNVLTYVGIFLIIAAGTLATSQHASRTQQQNEYMQSQSQTYDNSSGVYTN